MTTTTRRFLYSLFILLFFVAAAAVLYVAGGYRYDRRRRALTQPGIIVLDADPRPTDMSVDDAPAKTVGNPLRLGPLASGVHTVRLARDGYRPWQARLQVNDGQATTVTNIRLFRDSLPVEQARGVRRIVPAPDGSRIALIGTGGDLSLYETVSKTTTLLLPRVGGTVDDLAWLADGERLMLRTTADGVQVIRIVDRNGGATSLTTPFFADDVVVPSSRRSDQLWLLQGASLFSLATSTVMPPVEVAQSVAAWYEDGDRLLLFQTDGVLVERPANDLAAEPRVIARLGALQKPRFLTLLPSDLIALLDDATQTLQLVHRNKQPITTLTVGNVVNVRWQAGRQRLLLLNEHELFILAGDDDEPELVRRSGEPYSDAAWIGTSDTALVMQNDDAVLLDIRGLTEPMTIATGSGESLSVNRDGDTAYLLLDEKLFRIEL